MTDPPPSPPRRARLELLVRREDEESFELREVQSSLAFVQSRPQRIPDECWELAEVPSRVGRTRSFILKNKTTDRYLLLTEPERFLWEQMTGETSLQEMGTAYVLRYGQFDFEIIPHLIRKLQRAQLLTLRPSSRIRRVLARNRRLPVVKLLETGLTALERINVSSRRVQPFFQTLYRWGGFLLFTRFALILTIAFGVVGIVAGVRLWREADSVAAGLGAHPLRAILTVKLLFLLAVAAHQVVHGLALVHYGRRVREFGFTFLHGFVPTFYVDVTDIFMASRRARLITAVSGTLVHLLFGALWFLVAAATAPGFTKAFAAASGMLQWQAFLVALYPFCFIEMDGYHILVDWLGVPMLKAEALGYVGGLMRGTASAPATRLETLWLAYVVLSAVSIAAFVAFNVWMIAHAVH